MDLIHIVEFFFMIDGSHAHSGILFMIDGSHTHSGAFFYD
jgi:hypothetical protein